YVVVMKEVIIDVPVGPSNPSQPVGPENPIVPRNPEGNPIKPGDPIDPNNPDGPTWTDDQLEEVTKEISKGITRTITYVNDQGATVSETVTDKVTFTRPFKINVVTKAVTYGEWSALNGDDTFDAVTSPVITGYIASQGVVAVQTVTVDEDDIAVEVVYRPLGSYVPHVPAGFEPDPENPIPSIPYPNDPADPTKPGKPVTPIPFVPGTTPEGPDGQPLQPVDPTDPSKGYVPPVIPEDPSEDILIPYVPVPSDSDDGNDNSIPIKPMTTQKRPQLPLTGDEQSSAALIGIATLISALALVSARRRKKH
ncbi:mucin-binding protein, partial [Streptococcus pacificus]